ncbi:type II toxin-antitoxin system VapC family toxin [Aquisalimonas sp. APHAB1-3]|uniref:type II toxin-antitoxin system VapC family toxin n=1 Tax=Aquisalimonas sp. APHAB1-3 TaxID=3402080 RepID=UPI003AAAE309
MKALFDTNILIDYLNGIDEARIELGRHQSRAISIVTWMEVLVGAKDENEEHVIRGFLAGFQVIELDGSIAEKAITLRQQQNRIRLPDAIIQASAETQNALLVTRNTKDFEATHPGIRIPYTL